MVQTSGAAVVNPTSQRNAEESMRAERLTVTLDSLVSEGQIKMPNTQSEAEVLVAWMIKVYDLSKVCEGTEDFLRSEKSLIDVNRIKELFGMFKDATHLEHLHKFRMSRGWGNAESGKGIVHKSVGDIWKDTYGRKTTASNRNTGVKDFSRTYYVPEDD